MDNEFDAVMSIFNTSRILAMLFIIGSAIVLSRLTSSTLGKISEGIPRYRLPLKKFDSILRFVIFLGATVVILTNVLTLSSEAWLALGGTIAVTAGFALKDTAASVISGLLILIDRPFQVGDFIYFDKYYGEVMEIGLRTVRVKTKDDSTLSIPTNKFLTDSVASKNSGDLNMQVQIDVWISMHADFQLALKIAREACFTSRYIYLKERVRVNVSDRITPISYATRIRVRCHVIDARFESRMISDLTQRIKLSFKEAGILPPEIYNYELTNTAEAAS